MEFAPALDRTRKPKSSRTDVEMRLSAPPFVRGPYLIWLEPLRNKEWVVYAKQPFAGPDQVLAYLARYTHRVAISNQRLVSADRQGVTFKWKDYRISGPARYKTMSLSHHEFIRRFLLHVLPKGFMRVRHYGFLANRVKQQNLARCRQLLGVAAADEQSTARQTAEVWFEELTGIDLSTCPDCGGALIRSELPPCDNPRMACLVRSPRRRSRGPPDQEPS